MKQIKLECGFEAELDEAKIWSDMRMIEDMAAVDQGHAFALVRLTEWLLGEHKEALYQALEDEDGSVPPLKVRRAVTEIIGQLSEKNS